MYLSPYHDLLMSVEHLRTPLRNTQIHYMMTWHGNVFPQHLGLRHAHGHTELWFFILLQVNSQVDDIWYTILDFVYYTFSHPVVSIADQNVIQSHFNYVRRINDIAVLFAKFENDWTCETDVMVERVFARFAFKMSFGRISYIANRPWTCHYCTCRCLDT